MELLAPRRGLHWRQHATQGWPASLSDSPLQAAAFLRHHTCHTPQEEVYTTSEEDGELTASEQDSEPSASDQGEHDDHQPKCRASTSDFGAFIWTTQEWKLLLASGDVSDSDDTSEDDSKPRTHTKPSKYKTKWSASQVYSQIKTSLEAPGLHQLARAGAHEGQEL
jgi:hypothetical protein